MAAMQSYLFKVVTIVTYGYNKLMSKKIVIDGVPSRQHPLYNTWNAMMRRCRDPNNQDYRNYGGRGIKVYPRWHNSANFIRDMSPTYKKGLTLDRIDVNKGYYPSNCRWADAVTQARNRRNVRRIIVEGKTYLFADLAQLHGISYNTLKMRFYRDNYTPEELLAGKRIVIREQNNKGRFTGKAVLSV